MIEATELRIGNLVEHKGKFIMIDGVQLLQLWLEPNNNIEPIPLTEEWIGRIPQKEIDILKSFGIVVIEYLGDRRQIEAIGSKYNIVYDYVHQLQNLYFALTGEELKTRL